MKAMKQVRRACNNPDREYSDLTQVGAMEVIKWWMNSGYTNSDSEVHRIHECIKSVL